MGTKKSVLKLLFYMKVNMIKLARKMFMRHFANVRFLIILLGGIKKLHYDDSCYDTLNLCGILYNNSNNNLTSLRVGNQEI